MIVLEILNFLNFAIFTIWLSVIDLREKRLPNRLMYPAITIALGLAVLDILLNGTLGEIKSRFLPGLSLTLLFFLIFAIYPKGIGMGDVKGILLLGITLSGNDGAVLLFSVMASFILAGFVILILRLLLRQKFTEIPFGPFLFFPALAILAAQLLLG